MTDPNDLTIFITRAGAELVTDSRAVALAFRKRHKNVLQTITRMLQSRRPLIARHARLNFQPCTYSASNGKQEPMFRMTAKGMSELAMGFAGDDAREVRIRFLDAFQEVSDRLAAADRTIIERLFDLERRESPSRAKGRLGSKLMNERRTEKAIHDEERAALLAVAQPPLPLH